MKAVQFHEHGGREVLRLEEVPTPEPAEGDVLVRIRACALNHFDVDLRKNIARLPLPLPHILGIEFAGDVAEVGPGVEGLEEGQPVWILHEIPCLECEYCLAGMDNVCLRGQMYSVQRPGGYAEYALAPARAVFPLPGPGWHDAAAAGHIVFTTAWHMLMARGQLRAGENVVVNASGSGIGHAAVQIAKRAGATVIATAGSDDKLERSRADGADHVVNYRTEDLTASVLDLTDGHGADLVVEHVGGDLFGASLKALRKGGRLVTCGGHAGEVVSLDLVPVFRNEWRVIGSRSGTVRESELVMGLITDGELFPASMRASRSRKRPRPSE